MFGAADETLPGALIPPDAVASEMASFKELKLPDLAMAVVDTKFDPSILFCRSVDPVAVSSACTHGKVALLCY